LLLEVQGARAPHAHINIKKTDNKRVTPIHHCTVRLCRDVNKARDAKASKPRPRPETCKAQRQRPNANAYRPRM